MSIIAPDSDNVTGIQWSEQRYDEERAKLVALYGENDAEALAKRDQALANLFWRCGWTQDKLAEREKKDRSWITRRVLFGRFLRFVPMGTESDSLPKDLTERKFRAFWERTPKGTDERDRFKAVLAMMSDTTPPAPKRPSLGKRFREELADGKWRSAEKIAEQIEIDDIEHVSSSLQNAKDQGLHGLKVEAKQVGTKRHWRLMPADKTVTVYELTEKLSPILKALEEQATDHMAHWSPSIVLKHLSLLKRYLKEWAE
jgi:hypothetical protein